MEDRSAGRSDPGERQMRARGLIAHPAFVRVWVGQAVNVTGDAIFGVALALWLLDRHDSARALGMALGSLAVGTVVSILIGGVLADRYRRSRVIVVADLVRMASLAALVLASPRCLPPARSQDKLRRRSARPHQLARQAE